MEQVVGALQLQVLQGGDEVSGGDNNSKLVAQEQLDDAWRQRARHELGEEEEQTETQIGNLAASLPCDWPLPRWAFLELTSIPLALQHLFSGKISSYSSFCELLLSTRFSATTTILA